MLWLGLRGSVGAGGDGSVSCGYSHKSGEDGRSIQQLAVPWL